MPLTPMKPRYVADLFAPLHRELIALLRGLTPEEEELPTVAGAWRVRDVAAHLLDGMLRKLSRFSSARPLNSYEEIVAFLNELNATGVAYWRRVSPPVLTDILERAGGEASMLVEEMDPHGPALHGVAWAGEMQSQNWMNTGRDYTEWWHHQMQIRDAAGAPLLLAARWLAPLLNFSMRALPVAYAQTDAAEGASVAVYVDGEAWTVRREGGRWVLYEGTTDASTTTVRLDADTAWRILSNAPRGRAGA